MNEEMSQAGFYEHEPMEQVTGNITAGVFSPEFTGSTGEYFRIWIVNVVLTILTLGFYMPWAKVRTRRYFYLNSQLAGDPFDYLADPKKLLYGYLILGVFMICYNYLPTINPLLMFPILIVGGIGFPWVLYKSRRFFCRNSAYRNIRFRFTGTLGDAYANYLGLPILGAVTFGLAQPYVLFRQKEYFFRNVRFGGRQSEFSGTHGFFFKLYYSVGVLFICMMVLMVASLTAASTNAVAANGGVAGSVYAPIFFFYAAIFFAGFIVQAFETNYCWNNMEFPGVARFVCRIHPMRFAWIQISNIILSVLTLGLLIPWAKVRLARYRLGCMSVALYPAIDELVAEQADGEDGAFGDMAADEFDFEIGL